MISRPQLNNTLQMNGTKILNQSLKAYNTQTSSNTNPAGPFSQKKKEKQFNFKNEIEDLEDDI